MGHRKISSPLFHLIPMGKLGYYLRFRHFMMQCLSEVPASFSMEFCQLLRWAVHLVEILFFICTAYCTTLCKVNRWQRRSYSLRKTNIGSTWFFLRVQRYSSFPFCPCRDAYYRCRIWRNVRRKALFSLHHLSKVFL